MIEKKTTILFAFFYMGLFSVMAQSDMYAIASTGSLDLARAPDTKVLTSEAYQVTLASSAATPTSRATSAASFTFYRQATSVLLHLKNDRNQVTLQVTNTIGDTVQLLSEKSLAQGFYELPVLDQWLRSGVYAVRIVINEQVSTFQTIR